MMSTGSKQRYAETVKKQSKPDTDLFEKAFLEAIAKTV